MKPTRHSRILLHQAINIVLCLFGVAISDIARADKCSAEAEFKTSYPANASKSKFNFKFKVSSSDCDRYGCRGYIHYTVHFDHADGSSNGKRTLVNYTIPDGQKTVEITDDNYPSLAGSKIVIRDVEIDEVTCSTP